MMLTQIKANINSQGSVRPGFVWLRYVASALIVLAAGLTILNYWKVRPSEKIREAELQTITVVNPDKNVMRVSLPDSSTIWLQPGSEVSYPEVFGEWREVTMKGDVFFEVHRDTGHPFIVYSGKILTRVLGTSFRVRAKENDPTTTVSVLSGKVSVRRILKASEVKTGNEQNQEKGNEVLLLPYERVLFSDQAMVVRKNEKAGNRELEMWKRSTVSFDNVLVKDVLVTLNNLFEVKISTSSEKINRYLLKADFTGMNLPDILEILEASLDITYEINDDRIVLKPLD